MALAFIDLSAIAAHAATMETAADGLNTDIFLSLIVFKLRLLPIHRIGDGN
jgi:hypothetical protein